MLNRVQYENNGSLFIVSIINSGHLVIRFDSLIQIVIKNYKIGRLAQLDRALVSGVDQGQRSNFLKS